MNHGFQHADFEADSTFLFGEIATTGATVSSETNELYWNGDAGYFTVNSPFWQGATGYLGNKTIQLSDIGFTDIKTSDNLNFASIHLISLDSLPLAKSKRMILLTSARLENEGLLWNDEKTSLLSKGGTRALCEPVEAMVVLNNTNTDSCMVYKLNELGKRTDSLMLNQFGSNTRFILNKKTLWYEISNHKARSIPQAKQKTENSKSFLNVYPNPGKQYARVDFSFPGITEMNFVLYNSEGKLIQQKKMHAANRNIQQLRVDLSNLKNGLYFCGFEFSTGKRIIEKLMVTE